MPTLELVKTPIAALGADFLASRRGAGLSIRTVEHYQSSIFKVFMPWASAEGVTDPAQLTPALMSRFTAHLLEDGGLGGKPLARASVRSYTQSIRVFLGWVADPEGGSAAVGASPKMPKKQQLIVNVLSSEEITAMENAARTERDRLIIRVLAGTGVRLGELLALRVDDIRQQRPGEFFLAVHGKGSKDRLVPLAPKLRQRLGRFLVGRHAEGQDHIFVSLRRGPDGGYGQLTISGAEQLVRLAAKEAGIARRVYPHLFRHSFATEWLRRGGNVISLRNVLGHFDLSMISGTYSHLNTSDDYAAAMAVLLGKD